MFNPVFCVYLLLALMVNVLPTFACEGACIVDITNAFLGNYTKPLGKVFKQLAVDISTQLIPPASRPKDPIVTILPLVKAYANISYDSLEHAIFPSYFHGKCQRFSKDGSMPKGCPNPDCPVVCGTPGSLVHFYPKLRYIVFNNTRHVLETLVNPKSYVFTQEMKIIQSLVDAGTASVQKRRFAGSGLTSGYNISCGTTLSSNTSLYSSSDMLSADCMYSTHSDNNLYSRDGSPDVAKQLAGILSKTTAYLESACGGSVGDGPKSLPKCSWRASMEEFILTYP